MRHACLAFMQVGDDRLGHVDEREDTQADNEGERVFIDSNSLVFHSCGRIP
jgi:hypothetical protein